MQLAAAVGHDLVANRMSHSKVYLGYKNNEIFYPQFLYNEDRIVEQNLFRLFKVFAIKDRKKSLKIKYFSRERMKYFYKKEISD